MFIWHNLCFVLKVSYFINFSWCPSLTLFMFCLTISNFEPIIGYWKIRNESEKQNNRFISREKGLKLIWFLWKWLILTVWCIQNWGISNLRVNDWSNLSDKKWKTCILYVKVKWCWVDRPREKWATQFFELRRRTWNSVIDSQAVILTTAGIFQFKSYKRQLDDVGFWNLFG